MFEFDSNWDVKMLQDDQHSSMNTGNSKAFQHAEILQIGHQSLKVECTLM